MTLSLAGIVVPMITPLTADECVDHPAVYRLVDFLIEGGVDGIFVLGSIGEGPYLRRFVRQDLVETTVEAAANRVPVIAGVLEAGTARVVEEMRALEGRGISGYVVTSPFYFGGYRNDELLGHFQRIADAAALPIILYSIPQNTGVPLSADLVAQLARVPNIVGVKDSSGDWAEVQRLLLNRIPSFTVLQGMQTLAAVSLLAGADGLVPAHANICPGLLVGLMDAGRRRDVPALFAHQAQLDRLTMLRGRASVHSYKVVTKALGLTEDHVSSPLPRLGEEEARRFLADCVAAGLQLDAKAHG